MAAPTSNYSTELQTLAQILSVCVSILQHLTMSCLHLLVLKLMCVYGLLIIIHKELESITLSNASSPCN